MSHDVVVIGAGPAGFQAAIHASRRKASALIFGRRRGSSLFKASVENFCCLERSISGSELLDHAKKQVERLGVKLVEEDAMTIEKTPKGFKISTESGNEFAAKALVIATGVSRKNLGVRTSGGHTHF